MHVFADHDNFILCHAQGTEKLFSAGSKPVFLCVGRAEVSACDLLFELKEETGNCVRNLRMIVCVYNRKGKPMFLQSLDVREFEKFNIYKIKNLPIVSSKDISRIFVFPTKL